MVGSWELITELSINQPKAGRKTSHHHWWHHIRICLINKTRNTVGKFPALKRPHMWQRSPQQHSHEQKGHSTALKQGFFFGRDKSKSHKQKPACSQKTVSWFGSHYLVEHLGRKLGKPRHSEPDKYGQVPTEDDKATSLHLINRLWQTDC